MVAAARKHNRVVQVGTQRRSTPHLIDARDQIVREGRLGKIGLVAVVDQDVKRVGLIGCGWYGKCDLLRLIQVAPVEVVSLCDPDREMLAGAAEVVAADGRLKRAVRAPGNGL